MAAAYRAGSTFGDGQTATTASLPIVIPATAQVGDVVVVDFHNTVDTTTIATPAGWTALDSQPNALPSSNTSFLFAKEIAAGEPGSTVTFTASNARRFAGTITVYSGVTLAGYILAKTAETATTTAPVLPIAAGAPAGAMVVAIYSRRANVVGSAVGTITFPGYTAAVDESTAYTTTPQAHVAARHKVAGGAGSYGGETGAASVTGFGTLYVLVLPATGGGGSAGVGEAGGSWGFAGAAAGPATLPGLVDGVEPEGHTRIPPFVDSNGTLYRVTEEYGATGGPVQVTDGTHNQPRMMRSTDGGVAWAEVDKAGRPTDNDLESGWCVQVGTQVVFAFTDGGLVSFNVFNTSDAPVNPDTWVTKNERGISGFSAGSQQHMSLVRLSDGRFRAFYADTQAAGPTRQISLITRAAGGGWSAKTRLTVDADNHAGAVSVVGQADKSHIFYHDFTAKQVLYRTLTAADVLSTAVRADTTGTALAGRNYNAVSNPVHYDAAGTEVVSALFASPGALRLVSVVDGVVQAEQLVDANDVLISPANVGGNTGGDGPVCHLAAHGATLYAIWTDAASGDLYWSKRDHGGAWTARALLWDAPAGRHASWAYCNVYTRGGNVVLGYTYDDGPHEDNDSNIYYNEMILAAAPLPIPTGVAAGSFAFAGTAAGSTARRGVAAGSFAFAGTVAGSTARRGVAAGSFAFAGTAAGSAPLVGGASGTAGGGWGFAGAVAGSRRSAGAAGGETVWVGEAIGSGGELEMRVCVWTGTEWKPVPVQVWTGTAWESAEVTVH